MLWNASHKCHRTNFPFVFGGSLVLKLTFHLVIIEPLFNSFREALCHPAERQQQLWRIYVGNVGDV